MDEQERREPQPRDTAGQSFVKTIRPAGCVLFIVLAVLVGIICLTSGRDPVSGYQAPEDTAYYAAHPEELVQELEESIFPALPEYDMAAAVNDSGTVTVRIDDEHFVAGRAAILRYFDESLFVFERS
ncbi:MAG: hypothetical protein LUE21_04430 [Oscillospiraceae bacterium]|nr:hypothetical protein [Oscillospiraceae bacterium]